jgi:hypothetical protein
MVLYFLMQHINFPIRHWLSVILCQKQKSQTNKCMIRAKYSGMHQQSQLLGAKGIT